MKSALGWIIGDIGNSSIIIVECMALRDDILTLRNKCFSNL